MSLGDELKKDVSEIFSTSWNYRDGRKVPETNDVVFGNDAVKLEGVVLYADLVHSTDLVDTLAAWFAANVYKSYLRCASKIIRAQGGIITAFDGDRVMAVFIGNDKENSAVRAALKIQHAVVNIINPDIAGRYSNPYVVKQVVGIDSGELFVAKTGIRGSNDLVWVGTAANHAAKLCGLREGNYSTYISHKVYTALSDSSVKNAPSREMWQTTTWKEKSLFVHRTNWSMSF